MKLFRMVMGITLIIFSVTTAFAQTGTVEVTVTQIDREKGGQVIIGIFDAAGFPEIGKEIQGTHLETEGTSVTHRFKDIPIGKYAIAVFQDENRDGRINHNLLGAPKERYGFSNNRYGTFGPPDFKTVSIELKESNPISLTIELN